MEGPLERERIGNQRGYWLELGEGQKKGLEVLGKFKGAWGLGRPRKQSSPVGGGVRAGASPRTVWGWKSAPSGCFLAELGVFNINSNDCGGKIIGLSQIRRG